MSVSVDDVLEFAAALNPRGRLNGEEGVLFGDRDRRAEAVLVCWMPTVAAVRHAAAAGCGIIVSHEALTFHDYFPNASSPDPWTADRARLELLAAHGATVIRAHSTIDPTHVTPAFVKAVGLTPPAVAGPVWSVHDEPPISVHDLARRAAAGLGMDEVRVTGDPDRVVTRVGAIVGGVSQDRHLNVWEERLMGRGVEAVIGGETNDFAQRFAVDSGIAFIETCHSASEEPGLRVFAQDLAAALGGVEVVFHEEVVPWVTL